MSSFGCMADIRVQRRLRYRKVDVVEGSWFGLRPTTRWFANAQ